MQTSFKNRLTLCIIALFICSVCAMHIDGEAIVVAETQYHNSQTCMCWLLLTLCFVFAHMSFTTEYSNTTTTTNYNTYTQFDDDELFYSVVATLVENHKIVHAIDVWNRGLSHILVLGISSKFNPALMHSSLSGHYKKYFEYKNSGVFEKKLGEKNIGTSLGIFRLPERPKWHKLTRKIFKENRKIKTVTI